MSDSRTSVSTNTSAIFGESFGKREIASGTVIDGRYQIIEMIARGGMGTVYKARHSILHQVVALKVIHEHLVGHPEMRERFFREARAAMRVTHPNAIAVRDFGATPRGSLYMTLDFSSGLSLKTIIREQGPLAERRAIAIARQCLLALREAHSHGIIHRDLKPDNVLVETGPEGEVAKICDFGLAKLLETANSSGEVSLTGCAVVGTPHYMAPEQAAGENTDARTDLYAMGCILYEMVTGSHVFTGDSASKILMKHMCQAPEPPSRKVPSLSPRLEALILKALAKEPAARPQTAGAFLEELDGVVPPQVRSRRPLDVLVAEDSVVSQKIAARLLERWGHRVALASNGREALALLAARPFDVVVMDGQMPELDGFAATAELRAREAKSARRTTVIGMMADTTPESESRCRVAGMDGFVAKPLRPDVLFDAIERSGRADAPAAAASAEFDSSAALARVEGDGELLLELVRDFLDEAPAVLARMKQGRERGDGGDVARAAHELVGAAGNCSATSVREAALAVEEAALAGRDLGPAIDAVSEAFARVEQLLRKFIARKTA